MGTLFLTYNPTLVGTTRIICDWLQAGRSTGFEGAVCAPSEGDLTRMLAHNGFRYVTNPMPWPDKWRPWNSAWNVRVLKRWMSRNNIDVIQCNEHQVYPFAAGLSRASGRPVVCHIRCRIRRGFADWAFKKREPDALIWCTQFMRSQWGSSVERSVPSERQHIIPLGINLEDVQDGSGVRESYREDWSIDERQAVVGMVCFVRPGKRVEDFLSLAERLRHRPDVCFVLAGGQAAGDEQYFSEVRPKIEEAVTRGWIRWLGHVDPVAPFLQALDVFVSTSQHESFGMSVCEAMACGKAVAAYSAGSVQEIVGDTGLIVQTDDLDGLTDAVERLAGDIELRQRLGNRARQRVATSFNPAKSLEQLRQVHASILNGH